MNFNRASHIRILPPKMRCLYGLKLLAMDKIKARFLAENAHLKYRTPETDKVTKKVSTIVQ